MNHNFGPHFEKKYRQQIPSFCKQNILVSLHSKCANEVHSVSSPLRPVTVKPHLMADNSRPRDMPSQPEPTSSPHVSNATHPSTTGQARPPTLTVKWVLDEFQDVQTGLRQLGRPVTKEPKSSYRKSTNPAPKYSFSSQQAKKDATKFFKSAGIISVHREVDQ